eukprot:Hpha_TRINITY_DN15407_c1_g1::TRINITY_DN15407_c1_g1_i1::g.172979::m.172979/K19369/HSPB11; heat shock protein beta-11
MSEGLKTEVLLTSSNDDRFPGSNIVDGKEDTFWMTTGMYPQEILFGFRGNTVGVQRIRMSSYHIRRLRIEASYETLPIKFQELLHLELQDKSGQIQIESHQVSRGNGIRFVKIILQSGWDDFASVHSVAFDGDVEATGESTS